MGNNISAFATNSLSSVEDWMKTTQGNLTGSSRVGFIESRIMYDGGVTTIKNAPTLSKDGIQIAEQVLDTGYTVLNLSKHGDFVSSTEATHFAIQGDGMFMVTNKEGEIFYTRDGEFYENIQGQLVNSQGLVLVDSATAINMGLPYTPPAVTTQMLNNRDTGWTPLSFENTNGYAPWCLSGAGNISEYTVQAKKTFFLDGSKITGSETMTFGCDNLGYVIVNGNLVTPTGFGGWVTPTTLSIGQYLKDGANTILIQGTNVGAAANPAGFSMGGVINAGVNGTSVNLQSNATWAARAYSSFDLNPPKADAFATTEDDIVLADTSKKEKFEYSMYGATVFQAPLLSQSDFKIDGSEKQNLGKVLSKMLEASNVNVAQNLTEMALLGKVYNGFVQLIKAYNGTVDEVLSLLR